MPERETCSKQLYVEEYKALQEEHRNNRKLIFERPMLIVGVGGIVAQCAGKPEFAEIVLAAALFTLAYNLWFTWNRLQSDGRIVAYIQLVLEPWSRYEWIGWESALVRYRNYRHRLATDQQPAERPAEPAGDNGAPSPDGDEADKELQSLRFYTPIYVLHWTIALLTTCTAIIILSAKTDVQTWIAFGVFLVSLGAFIAAVLKASPRKLQKGFHDEWQVWTAVLAQVSDSKPARESVANGEALSPVARN